MAEPNAPANWTFRTRLMNGMIYGKKSSRYAPNRAQGSRLERGRTAGRKISERLGREGDFVNRRLKGSMPEGRGYDH